MAKGISPSLPSNRRWTLLIDMPCGFSGHGDRRESQDSDGHLIIGIYSCYIFSYITLFY